MITTNTKLPVGAVMYLPEYPGNVYRNLHKGKAEFIENRHSNTYRGCVVDLGVGRMVATEAGDQFPEPCAICGNPADNGVDGFCTDCLGDETDTLDHSLL